MSAAQRALEHARAPALVFDAAVDDDCDVFDLRLTDIPRSDVELRNEARQRWRASKRLVVRVDEQLTPAVRTLLFELARREVRLTAQCVDRFDEQHTLVVKTTASRPPPALVPYFPVRVRGRIDARRR